MPLPRLFLGLILVLIGAICRADIEPSKNWLISSRDRKMFAGATEDFGFPSPPISRGIAVIARQYGGSLTLLAVGHKGLDAKAIARAVDKWRAEAGLSGTVHYSDEEEGPTASFKHRSNHFLGSVSKTSVPVRSLIAALKEVDSDVSPLWSIPGHAARTISGPPSKTPATNSTRMDFRTGAPERIEVAATVPPSAWFLIGAFGLYVPLVVLIGFGLAVAYARRQEIPIETRRKRFTQLGLGFTFGGIFTHIPIVVAIMVSDVGRKAADGWLGTTRPTDLLMPVPLLGFPFVLLALPLSSRMETKLFGPQPGDPVIREPSDAVSLETPKWKTRLSWAIGIVGFSLWIGSYFLGSKSDFAMPLKILGMLMFFFRPFKFDRAEAAEIPDPATVNLANMVAYEMREKPVPVKVYRAPGDAIGAMVWDKKEIRITRAFELDLTEDEKRFILAHEYAHIATPAQFDLFAAGAFLSIAAFPTLAIFGVPMRTEIVAVLFPIVCILIALSFLTMRRRRIQGEFEADRRALVLIRNLEAAKSALHKLQFGSSLPYAHDSDAQMAHPAMKRRIENLESVAGELNLRPPSGSLSALS